MAKEYVNKASAAGRPVYAKTLERILKDKVCPFCEEYFLKYHTKPILKKGAHWIVTKNMSPYEGTKQHILFVHRGHIEDIASLSPAAAAELIKLASTYKKKYKLPGASLFMRTGDTNYTGASVRHLHASLLSGTKSRPRGKAISVVLGYKK